MITRSGRLTLERRESVLAARVAGDAIALAPQAREVADCLVLHDGPRFRVHNRDHVAFRFGYDAKPKLNAT